MTNHMYDHRIAMKFCFVHPNLVLKKKGATIEDEPSQEQAQSCVKDEPSDEDDQ